MIHIKKYQCALASFAMLKGLKIGYRIIVKKKVMLHFLNLCEYLAMFIVYMQFFGMMSILRCT